MNFNNLHSDGLETIQERKIGRRVDKVANGKITSRDGRPVVYDCVQLEQKVESVGTQLQSIFIFEKAPD